jgi:putative SOS response-associated peptidase YedK
MCNLYSITRDREAIRRLFRVSHNRTVAFEPMNAIFPNYNASVVRGAADGERELVMMSWGFVLLQQGRAPKRVTNVRDDKVTSPFWRDSFEQRRCLVPASSFCEPNGDVKPATWHWFALKGDNPRPLFAFPGVWRHYRGPIKKQGPNVDLDVYAFLTTLPNELVGTINHERMPVLLTGEEQFETWLKGSPAEALAQAQRYPAEQMRVVQEGLDKEDLLAAA